MQKLKRPHPITTDYVICFHDQRIGMVMIQDVTVGATICCIDVGPILASLYCPPLESLSCNILAFFVFRPAAAALDSLTNPTDQAIFWRIGRGDDSIGMPWLPKGDDGQNGEPTNISGIQTVLQLGTDQ